MLTKAFPAALISLLPCCKHLHFYISLKVCFNARHSLHLYSILLPGNYFYVLSCSATIKHPLCHSLVPHNKTEHGCGTPLRGGTPCSLCSKVLQAVFSSKVINAKILYPVSKFPPVTIVPIVPNTGQLTLHLLVVLLAHSTTALAAHRCHIFCR